jgi:hypothetical protein
LKRMLLCSCAWPRRHLGEVEKHAAQLLGLVEERLVEQVAKLRSAPRDDSGQLISMWTRGNYEAVQRVTYYCRSTADCDSQIVWVAVITGSGWPIRNTEIFARFKRLQNA